MEEISKHQAKQLWLHAQGLNRLKPFGTGKKAVVNAVSQLGYVQIDTINVIERCHHHILFNRIPGYRPSHLHKAQALDKTVFEYWTHALSYIATNDFRFFMPRMNDRKKSPSSWFNNVDEKDTRNVLNLIKKNGPLSIRAFDSDILVEKTFAWGTRKPSKKALQKAFYGGDLTVSERLGMLIKYDLLDRHFVWKDKPKPASEQEYQSYLLDRSLRSQAVVSLDSICYLDAPRKKGVRALIEQKVKANDLLPVKIQGFEKKEHWLDPKSLKKTFKSDPNLIHILSPFDPLIIQRKRLKAIFDYEHLFEAYVPREKRVFGYFTLPVLAGDKIIALLDLKTDRQAKKLLIQSWHWLAGNKSRDNKRHIETALNAFEEFQLSTAQRN
jgi:uncharacterized protein YcaQ